MWTFAGALAGADAVAWLGPARYGAVAGRFHLPLLAFALVAGVADVLRVHFEYRHQAHVLTFAEVALVVGLLTCRPTDMLLGSMLGFGVALAFVLRQRPAKLCFNLAVRALELGLATMVFRALLGTASALSPRAWLAAFVAVVVADLLSFACVFAVIRLTAGPVEPATLAMVGALNLAVATANCGFGLIAVLLIAIDPRSVLLMGGIITVLAVVYREYTTVRQRYANLRLLYGFSGALASARPGDDVLRQILEQSAALVQAERAELTLPTGNTWVRLSLDENGELRREHGTDPEPIAATVLAAGEGIVVPSSGAHALRSLLNERGQRDLVASALLVDDKSSGALIALNRDSDVRTFDREDLALFQALANHASVALRNAQLLDRLTEEAAHRAHQAMHDALTGLGNRELFAERVKHALSDQRGGRFVAVMLMDLDEFKEINDTLGHHTGDTVLREIAARLSRAIASRGTVARLGGDEFAVAIPGCTSTEQAISVAQELRQTVEQPLLVDELVLELHVSVGVAISPDHGEDPSALLQRADVAMYSAKGARRGVELYSAERDHYSERRLALSGELRQAISAGALGLAFQPKANLRDGLVTGVEALVRWHHPRHGFVPPDEFIPVAEQSGLIQPLTRWVLGQALHQLGLWRQAGLDLTVAVNLSARSLLDAGLVEDIARALTYAAVPPSALVLELTESTVMADPDRSQVVLQQLSDLGCSLAIDDFGTGYSSLSRLKQLPVDEIKVDKSFVLHMATDSEDTAIVRSIIDLARNLGLGVVAEGVEDLETLDRLRALGCDTVQGYYLCRPSPGPDIDLWLASQQVRRLPTSRAVAPARAALMPAQPSFQ